MSHNSRILRNILSPIALLQTSAIIPLRSNAPSAASLPTPCHHCRLPSLSSLFFFLPSFVYYQAVPPAAAAATIHNCNVRSTTGTKFSSKLSSLGNQLHPDSSSTRHRHNLKTTLSAQQLTALLPDSDIMGPRWKGKGAETEALSDPMSNIVSQLHSSLALSNSQGLLMSSCVLLKADPTQTDLLIRACFGDPVITAEKDKQYFHLSMEEAFYLFYVLKCIKIATENNSERNVEQLWMYISSRRDNFPYSFKAYSHLRMKNWVVKSGYRYGVDFVAYPHHPRLVHSEYAVLVLSEDDRQVNGRLRVWSDYECTLRLCGSVAKTLLLLNIQKHGKSTESRSCLESFSVEEQTITRWNPEQCRENQTMAKAES